MKGNASRFLLLLITAHILSSGCAKISSPSGGPRDREIPVIIESKPLNGSVNFRGKEISITFNEYVVLDKITEKFMVSPPMKNRPKVFTRGKDVRIQFEDTLRKNSTYTFYFQDAIRDLNENNAINNYQFVVSTGPVVDSLSVTGNVYSALSLDPPESALVLLYSQMADTFVVKQLPDYITRAEKNGDFRIDNVKPGRYRLYALRDADNSKNYNNRDEEFAFYPDTVQITPEKNFLPIKKDTAAVEPEAKAARQIKPATSERTTRSMTPEKPAVKPPVKGEYLLIMFQAEKRNHYLTSSKRPLPYQLIYTLSLPPGEMKFNFRIPDINADKFFIENTRNKDTITVWLTDSTVYNKPLLSTIIQFPFTDSLGITDLKTDTIVMRYLAPRAPRGKVIKRTPYKVDLGIKGGQLRPDIKVKFTAPTPFREPDTSKIKLFEMVKEEKTKVPLALFKDSANSCRYLMKANLQAGKNYLFIADSAAFKDIYGNSSDSTGIRFSLMTPESFGKITLNIKNHSGGRIIQLLDRSEKILRERYMSEDGKLEFPLLEKGFYRIRAIFDLNGDRKWTTGDFETHLQPEPVSYYPAEIEVKENWELFQDWNLEEKNFKDPKLLNAKTSGRN